MSSGSSIIGEHPTASLRKKTISIFLTDVAFVALFIYLYENVPHSTIMTAMVAALILLYMSAVTFRSFLLSFLNGRTFYQPALEAIRNGFSATYCGRGSNCQGIALVDEQAKTVYINGSIIPFATIETIDTYTARRALHLRLRWADGNHSGEETLSYSSTQEDQARQFQGRLSESLDEAEESAQEA